MAFTTVLCTLALGLLTIQVARSQEPFDSQNICLGGLNRDTWLAIRMNDFLSQYGTDRQDEIARAGGFLKFALRDVSTNLADTYLCGPPNECLLEPLNLECPNNPPVATTAKGLANWSNYWSKVVTTSAGAADFVRGAGNTLAIFNPGNEPASAASKVDLARLGLILPRHVLALFDTFPPLILAKQGFVSDHDYVSIFQGLLNTVGTSAGDESITQRYNQFADISESSTAIQQITTNGLNEYIRTKLNDANNLFFSDSLRDNVISQIEAGDFAAPVEFGANQQRFEDQIKASIASPAINRIWNGLQVVVVKVRRENLPNNANPCNGNDILPLATKFCDDQGTAYMLRRIPANLDRLGLGVLRSMSAFDVPGINNIGDFGLTPRSITEASRISQGRHGYLGVPESDDALVQQLLGLNLLQDNSLDTLFFNLPECDFSLNALPQDRRTVCEKLFNTDFTECIFNSFMLCACPAQNVNGQPWPYQTAGSEVCDIDPNPPRIITG